MTNTKMVTMNIKPAAAKRIKSYVKQGQVVLLTLNDGSNKYSKVGGTCTIGANFQFVVLDQIDPDYQIKINNNVDLTLYTAEPEMVFLENELVVDEQNATLSLSDGSGLIDGAVSISNYEPSQITKKDLQEGKTC